jgi:dipeptidyl aminopeptidase/acylaminoacyl peptidase
VILFSDVRKVVYRVSESGGEPAQATQLDLGRQEQHWAPHFLPDGYHFLYSVVRQGEAEREIRVGALDSNLKKVVAHASSYAEYAQGYLLFRSTGSRLLMAQPFSIQRLDTTQDPLPITGQPEVFHQSSASPFSTSQNGVLVFLGDRSLVHLRWFDRTGHSVASVAEETWAYRLRLSPDGQRAAVEIFSSLSFNRDLWIYEVSRQVNSKFTFETTTVTHPVWSPDGSRIAFTIAKGNGRGFYVRASDGSGGNEVLLEPDEEKTTSDWSPNGQYISYNLLDRSKKEKMQIAILPLFGNRKPDVYLSSNSDQRDGQFSPDGHWIAFTSDETGKAQIYVARFPKPRGKQQVSVAGGSQPRWRRDGKELFFLDPDEQLMAAEVSLRNSDLEISEPRPLFKAHPIRVEIGMVYDVAPDGQRFLIPTRMDERTPPINLLLNWPAAVKRD